MSAGTTNVPYNPYYDLETGVQQGPCGPHTREALECATREEQTTEVKSE